MTFELDDASMVGRPSTGDVPAPWIRGALFVLGFTSVASLLGWVYGVSSFTVLFRVVTLPGSMVLVGVAIWATIWAKGETGGGVRDMLAIGTVAGLIGTFGYDVFRIPFVYGGGFLVLSPIESYGVLATGAESSSGWTDMVGWTYHLSNGVGFGIAYAAIALRRHWAWGVLFAALLETGTVLTPFASSYQLEGKYFIIGVAYAAHVPFGLALGKLCQHPERTRELMAILGRHVAPISLGATIVGLALWLQPWALDSNISAGRAVADGPSLIVQQGLVSPEFVALERGECAVVRNADDVVRTVTLQETAIVLAPTSESDLCPTGDGVFRLKSDAGPFTGGFLIVDPER